MPSNPLLILIISNLHSRMGEERSSMDALAFDLRKPEEVTDYMKNLRIEYQYQCYQEKLGDGCHRLADFYEAFKKDLPEARSIYKHACDAYKYPLSCYKHANYASVGKAGEKNTDKALVDYNTGCTGGHLQSCYRAALLLQSSDVQEKNFVAASQYLKNACDQNHVESCNLLSTYFLLGKPGIKKDLPKAFSLSEKCCHAGHMYACVNVSVMYKKGDGVDKNMEKSNLYKQRAKDLHKSVTETERTIEFGK